jgi:ferredoxin-type protein NapG
VVHSSACTGCGKCEASCVLETAAIKVFPTAMAKGVLGKHYRIGWEEKEKAGGSLVAPEIEHRYNMPEGMHYEHGKGLSPSAPPSGQGVDGLTVPHPGANGATTGGLPPNIPGGGLTDRLSSEAPR